jgi:hypothetical protein
MRRPCWLLAASGNCSVYAARPAACRSWVSFSQPDRCAIIGGNIECLDIDPLRTLASSAYDRMPAPAAIAGPMQFITLLALWHLLAQKNFMRTIHGTLYADGGLCVLPWLHLDGDSQELNSLRKRGMRALRERGDRYIPPATLLQHAGFLAACDGLNPC